LAVSGWYTAINLVPHLLLLLLPLLLLLLPLLLLPLLLRLRLPGG
jgi:hypothetical protein